MLLPVLCPKNLDQLRLPPTGKYHSSILWDQGKSRRSNVATRSEQQADIPIHAHPCPPQPAQGLPQTQPLLQIESAGALNDFLEVTGKEDN